MLLPLPVITDRDELDKQIERVFKASHEPVTRTRSGHELMKLLGQATPRLLCSLVHKFGRKDRKDDFEAFIKELEAQPSPAVGEIRWNYLLPALRSGLVEMTIPDRPKSSRQQYRLTAKGELLRAKLLEKSGT